MPRKKSEKSKPTKPGPKSSPRYSLVIGKLGVGSLAVSATVGALVAFHFNWNTTTTINSGGGAVNMSVPSFAAPQLGAIIQNDGKMSNTTISNVGNFTGRPTARNNGTMTETNISGVIVN